MKEWMKDFQLQELTFLYTLSAKCRKELGVENPPSKTWKFS